MENSSQYNKCNDKNTRGAQLIHSQNPIRSFPIGMVEGCFDKGSDLTQKLVWDSKHHDFIPAGLFGEGATEWRSHAKLRSQLTIQFLQKKSYIE